MSINRRLKRKVQTKILEALEIAIKNKDFAGIEDLHPKIQKIMAHPNNLAMLSDAYKYSHPDFYPNKTSKIMAYLESRGGKFSKTVFFGLQIFIKEYLSGVAILKEDVDEAFEYLGTKYGVFGREDVFDRSRFDYIVEEHGGKLPILIKGAPEGSVIDVSNVMMTIENTDPKCAWLTNFLETILLQVWLKKI